jgi:hypothetical protein
MKKLNLNNKNELFTNDLDYYAGKYSFMESLKLGGTGSTKLIYKSGIIEIENLITSKGNDFVYINLELLKNGLLLRTNSSQNIKCFGFRLDEIKTLSVTVFKVQIRVKKFGVYVTKIVNRGELEIKDGNSCVRLLILVKDLKSFTKFMNKPILKEKLKYIVSNNEPEKEESYIM